MPTKAYGKERELPLADQKMYYGHVFCTSRVYCLY
jgi:hypothetical protein